MQKIKILKDIKIEKIWYQWIWISTRDDGKKIIIKWWVLPWTIVDCKVIKQKKDYIEAQVIDIKDMDFDFEPNQDLCAHYFFNKKLQNLDSERTRFGCGWCKWQILPYEKQLELKQDIFFDSFRNIKDIIETLEIKPVVPSPLTTWYRNKIEFSFGKFISKKLDEQYHCHWNVWFHKQWEFSKIVDVENCKLISEKANNIFAYLKNILKDSGLDVYDQKTQKGFFRHLMIREWSNTWQMLVILSVADEQLKDSIEKDKWEKLKEILAKDSFLNENIKSLVISYNNWLADVFKPTTINTSILRWEWYIFEKLLYKEEETEVTFKISPFSFFQTNTFGAQKLFNVAKDLLGKTDWALLDLYCGSGSIWLSFLKLWICDQVFGIEIVPDAIQDAFFNAKINWLLEKSYFTTGKAETLLSQDPVISANLKNIKTIVVDPPREWLHKNVIDFLLNIKKNLDIKLVYISCNPMTMSRDIKLLVEWYKLKAIQTVDMFPHTNHLEVVWLLE